MTRKKISMAAQPVPRALLHGYASGALFLTFFGALWALLTTSALTSQQRVLLVVVVTVVTGTLAYTAVRLLRVAQQLPRSVAPEARAEGTMIFKWYALVVMSEFVAIALASIVLG